MDLTPQMNSSYPFPIPPSRCPTPGASVGQNPAWRGPPRLSVSKKKLLFLPSSIPAFALGALTGSVVMKAQIKRHAEMIEVCPVLQNRLQMVAALQRRYEGKRKRRGDWRKEERERSPGVEPSSQGSVQVSLEAGVLLANTLHQSWRAILSYN